MSSSAAATELRSGKTHRDENFPVASVLIEQRHRPVILSFYRFARDADDIADHATLSPEAKLELLEDFRATLMGERDTTAVAIQLRDLLKSRNLTVQHAVDLLEAFRRDVTVLRYPDWNALLDYCRYSAMPVGRFVLDVHGEARETWPANDALCAALQIINHLQDCKKDCRELDRIYLPQDALLEAGLGRDSLLAEKASPALQRALTNLARRTTDLWATARPFAARIRNARLAFEVSAIQSLAEDLAARLARRDPLSQRVHHTKLEMIPLLTRATLRFATTRFGAKKRRLRLRGDPR